jgi:hypothetical protein
MAQGDQLRGHQGGMIQYSISSVRRKCRFMAHPSRGNYREGRPVTARKRTLALSRSLLPERELGEKAPDLWLD